jgi:hypothetical protein
MKSFRQLALADYLDLNMAIMVTLAINMNTTNAVEDLRRKNASFADCLPILNRRANYAVDGFAQAKPTILTSRIWAAKYLGSRD